MGRFTGRFNSKERGFSDDLAEMVNPFLPYQRHSYGESYQGYQMIRTPREALAHDFALFPNALLMMLDSLLELPTRLIVIARHEGILRALADFPLNLGQAMTQLMRGAIQLLLSPITLVFALTTRLVSTAIYTLFEYPFTKRRVQNAEKVLGDYEKLAELATTPQRAQEVIDLLKDRPFSYAVLRASFRGAHANLVSVLLQKFAQQDIHCSDGHRAAILMSHCEDAAQWLNRIEEKNMSGSARGDSLGSLNKILQVVSAYDKDLLFEHTKYGSLYPNLISLRKQGQLIDHEDPASVSGNSTQYTGSSAPQDTTAFSEGKIDSKAQVDLLARQRTAMHADQRDQADSLDNDNQKNASQSESPGPSKK